MNYQAGKYAPVLFRLAILCIIMRAYTVTGEKWSEEEREQISRYFYDFNSIVYVPENADSTKNMLKTLNDEEMEEFLDFGIGD